jgi:hypothetical protein
MFTGRCTIRTPGTSMAPTVPSCLRCPSPPGGQYRRCRIRLRITGASCGCLSDVRLLEPCAPDVRLTQAHLLAQSSRGEVWPARRQRCAGPRVEHAGGAVFSISVAGNRATHPRAARQFKRPAAYFGGRRRPRAARGRCSRESAAPSAKFVDTCPNDKLTDAVLSVCRERPTSAMRATTLGMSGTPSVRYRPKWFCSSEGCCSRG